MLIVDKSVCFIEEYKQNDTHELSCDCPDACDNTYYTTSVSTAEYPSDLVIESIAPIFNVTETHIRYVIAPIFNVTETYIRYVMAPIFNVTETYIRYGLAQSL